MDLFTIILIFIFFVYDFRVFVGFTKSVGIRCGPELRVPKRTSREVPGSGVREQKSNLH